MKHFGNIARLIKESRLKHPKGFSQSELSMAMGYKNGQFISNIERGLCSTPLKSLYKLTRVLEIDKDVLKAALIKDMEQTLDHCFKQEENSDSGSREENFSALEA